MNLSKLPECVLDNIFDKCTFRSRLNLSHACRQLYDYFDPDAIWRLALVETFGSKWEALWALYAQLNQITIDENDADYTCHCAAIYRLLVGGLGGHIKREIVDEFDGLTRHLKVNLTRDDECVEIGKALNLNRGVSDEQFTQLERVLRVQSGREVTLHEDFKSLYRILNGQKLVDENMRDDVNLPVVTPLFGYVAVYDLVIAPYLLEIDTIIKYVGAQTGRAGHDLIVNGRIPLVIAPGRNAMQTVWYFDNDTGRVLCPRINSELDDYQGERVYSYIIASSLPLLLRRASEIIEETAKRIEGGEKLFDVSGFAQRLFIKQSSHFCITVRTCFLYNESSIIPPNYQFAYQVTQSMDKNAPKSESMQLERRYWKIDDLCGNKDEIDGPGVIGQYPKLTPGTYHTYASRTSFTVTRGTMGGFFTYRKLTQNRQSMLPTPTFTLQVPEMSDN